MFMNSVFGMNAARANAALISFAKRLYSNERIRIPEYIDLETARLIDLAHIREETREA